MGKAFTIHKNKTVPVIPHVNYMYGVSNKRFNRVITTTRMPDYFTYLGGTHPDARRDCAFCVFDGILYTAFGISVGSGYPENILHADRLGDGAATNDSSEMADSPKALGYFDCSGLVIKDSKPYFITRHGKDSNNKYVKYAVFYNILSGKFDDLASNKWSEYASTNSHGSSQIIDRRFAYSMGGYATSSKSQCNYLDVSSRTFSSRASLPGGRHSHATCAVDNRYIYLAGGLANSTKNLQSSFWRYDHTNNSWTTLTSLPFVSRSGCLIHDQRNKDRIWFFGGSTSYDTNYRNSIYYYSISGNTWTQFSQTLPMVSRTLNGFCTPEGVMILFNFETAKYVTSSNVYAFDPDPYKINPTSDTRPNALILYCNSLLGRNRRIRPIISSKVTGNPYINLFAIKEINNKTPGPLLYAGSSTSSYRTQFLDYFNNFKTVHYIYNVPSANCNINNILDYSVKEIGGMFKWDKL